MKLTTKDLTKIGVFGALTIVLGLTPLGMIPIGPVRVTTLHIPTIVAALVAGPWVSLFVGLLFGLFSLVNNIIAPTILSFMFYNPLVSVLPRVLIAVVTYQVYNKLRDKNDVIRYGIPAICGSVMNTVGVLGMAFICHSKQIESVMHVKAQYFLGGMVPTNMPFEIVISFVLAILIAKSVNKNK